MSILQRIRRPYRAGSFYAATKSLLTKQIEECFLHRFGPHQLPRSRAVEGKKTMALISPHAGYMYSGPIAAQGYYHVTHEPKPDTIIIVGPNHTGFGSGASIMIEGKWQTPLGEVQINSTLAHAIQSHSQYLDIDENAHTYEHSIEVQLPFLQYVYDSFSLVPICMMMQDLEVSQDIGTAISTAATGANILIIASTDFSHYEPQNIANTKDRLAIDAILRLDEAGLQSVVETQGISMCGYGPVSVSIVAAKKLGAVTSILLQYKTSGDITGNPSQVVGYASIALTK